MMIPDLTRATAADIDLDMVEAKLWNIRRFQGHPGALVVRQHTHLARALAIRDNAPDEVVEWAFFHDDHESLIGDIHGLVVSRIDKETDFLSCLTGHLDRCICERRGIDYPSPGTRRETHVYDKMAESIEWRFGLGWPPSTGGQHPEWPSWLDDARAEQLFNAHRSIPNPSS